MKLYNIADLTVQLNCFTQTMERANKYICKNALNNKNPDVILNTVEPGLPDIDFPLMTEEIKAYVYEGKLFYKELINNFNGMMIHSSAIVVDGNAYLFSAPSGTGKSTHTSFWLKKFGDRAYILNDDKPAVRVLDDGVFAYGTPWSGKFDISVNKKARVAGICFLERDEENWIKPMSEQEKVINMYHSSIRKIEKPLAIKLFQIISQIIERVPIYKMGCTPTEEAAELAYETMREKV